jgi:hypothetical protein
MNDQQILTIALASAPTMITVLVGILVNNARLSDMNSRISELSHRMDTGFRQVDVRLEEMKELWRSELHRVEEILDARLKHIEDR